jgi:pectinesterase
MDRRSFLQSTATVVAGEFLGCATQRRSSFAATVAPGRPARSGPPVFASIQAAIDAAPVAGTEPYRIFVAGGRWREKLTIDKPFIQLVGEDRRGSVVTYDAYAGQAGPDGQPRGTSGTATITVRAPDFGATNLTIENAFDHLGYLARMQGEPTGANRAQALALMLDDRSDRAYVDHVDIAGYQDTLFANAGRSLFRDCRVSGTVDFVFGAGRAVLDGCEIVSRYRPGRAKQGYVAAPSTPASQEYGLTFMHCRLTREKELPASSVSLGRAWRPTRAFADGNYGDPNAVGLAVYLSCWMDEHIEAQGWDAMQYNARDGTRVWLKPEDARFFEYDSRGPGARSSAQRRILPPRELSRYEISRVLDGWNAAE